MWLDIGLKLVSEFYRKYRLIEVFLVYHLDYTSDQIHEEAEVLEHTVSDLFVKKLDSRNGPFLRSNGGNGGVLTPTSFFYGSAPPTWSCPVQPSPPWACHRRSTLSSWPRCAPWYAPTRSSRISPPQSTSIVPVRSVGRATAAAGRATARRAAIHRSPSPT